MQVSLFNTISFSNCFFMTGNLMLLSVCKAFRKQVLVKFFDTLCTWNWHHEIPSGITYKIFNQAFFITTGNVTKVSFKSVVGCKGSVSISGYCMFAKAFFNSDFCIIENQSVRNTSKVIKHSLLGFQKCFKVLSSE